MKSKQQARSRRGIFRAVRPRLRPLVSLVLATQLGGFPLEASLTARDKPASTTAPDAVLATMKEELNRAKSDLAKSDPTPYFLSYTVYDQDQV